MSNSVLYIPGLMGRRSRGGHVNENQQVSIMAGDVGRGRGNGGEKVSHQQRSNLNTNQQSKQFFGTFIILILTCPTLY